jgi:chromosome segregation ATPase
MELTTGQAADLTGKSRTTIWRYCKHGKLSSRPNDEGDYIVDASELERVFGKLRTPGSNQRPESGSEPSVSNNEILQLQKHLELSEELISRLKDELAETKDEKERIFQLLEKQTNHMDMLTGEIHHLTRKKSGFSIFNMFQKQKKEVTGTA